MDKESLKEVLELVRKGEMGVEECMERLSYLPFESIDLACIDHHRALRKSGPEVIFGEGKSAHEILQVSKKILERGQNLLVTRLDPMKAKVLQREFPLGDYHERSRLFMWIQKKVEPKGKGRVLVVSAGTSDIPVAEEAFLTLRFLGDQAEAIYDVGVAGIHRLFAQLKRLREARVLIVVAGMEGALPSIVAGLVDVPVIAVPTSVGYGASLGGLSALLGMLNSCAQGVAVVNIDNGFGAGYLASIINAL